jgi:5-oxoprolinase (ATP-hydrolysing) subunit A
MSLLLNVDLGELPSEPEALYAQAHVANVACGGHAGDEASMRRAVERCRVWGTRLGAHPSYPDRAGFGRRAITLSPDALAQALGEQCSGLVALARQYDAPVEFVKAHGALYQAAARDPATARILVLAARGVLGGGITIIGPPASGLERAAAEARVGYAREGFADRAVRDDGTLVPRDEPGAVIVDPAAVAARARELALRDDLDTICVHGDTPGSVALVTAVRGVLDSISRSSR